MGAWSWRCLIQRYCVATKKLVMTAKIIFEHWNPEKMSMRALLFMIFRYINILFGNSVVFFFNLNLCYNKVSYDSSQSNGICNISKGSVWSCQRPLLIINSENLVWRAIKILPLWIIKKGKLLGLVSSLMETLKETASSCKWNAYQLFIILWLLILDKVLFELELRII